MSGGQYQELDSMFSTIRTLLLATLVVGTTASHAQCFQPSPNLSALGKKYHFLMDSHKYQWTAEEQKAKQALFKSAFDSWQGDYTEIECFGTERNPREVKTIAEVKAELQEAMNGILRGNVWKRFNEQKKVSSDVLELFDNRNLFAGKIVAGGIEGTQIFTRRFATGGTQMEESISRLQISGDKLVLIRDIYLNGYLARQERYQLKRD